MLKKYVLFFLIVFALNQVTIAQIIPSYVPINGLVSWYPFSGNANDISGNANHGSVTGSILTTDRFGLSNASYSFNGGNNRIVVPNAGNLNPNYISVSVWTKPSMFTNSWQYIIDKSQDLNSTYVNRSWSIRITSAGLLELEIRVNNVFYVYTSSSTISLNNWNHLVFEYDGQFAKLYFNTNLVINQNVVGLLPSTNNSDLSIGYFPHVSMPPYGYFWNGKIDDIGIWNRALSQEEITSLFNGAPAGVDLVNASSTIDFFPNPVKNKLNIHTHAKFVGSVYRLSDQIGKTLKNGTIQDENTEIDLSMFSSGIYFLSIDNDKKEVFKIIKE